MRYFAVSLGLALREQARRKRLWILLALLLACGFLARGSAAPAEEWEAPVRVGMAFAAPCPAFQAALEARGGSVVRFIPADEAALTAQVAAGRWDCGLVFPADLEERLAAGDVWRLVTLVTGPGSAAYPLVRETVAAAVLERVSPAVAADYLRASGILDEAALAEARPRLAETLPRSGRVRLELRTLDGRALEAPALAEESGSRILRGVLAAALLVWALSSAVDLGAWRESPAARRMAPCLPGTLLILPRLLAALAAGLCLGWACLLAAGEPAGRLWILPLYLAALGGLDLCLLALGRSWRLLPAVIPFAAAGTLVLSPVFADLSLLFPALGPVSAWLPVTLYLRGDAGAGARLLLLAVLGCAASLFLEGGRAQKRL